jgi:hypothetical protein
VKANAIPTRIQWDAVPDADRYVVYVQVEGCEFNTFEIFDTSIVLGLPPNKAIVIFVCSRQGQLENIDSDSMHVYATRW